jgi:hypothetical protein
MNGKEKRCNFPNVFSQIEEMEEYAKQVYQDLMGYQYLLCM